MNRQGGEAFAKLMQQLNRARLQANGARAAGGGGGGGGGPQIPGGALAGGGLIAVLLGGGLLLNSSVYNGELSETRLRMTGVETDQTVDGGHRAIKYSRLHGIRSDIYNEGTHLMVRRRFTYSTDAMYWTQS